MGKALAQLKGGLVVSCQPVDGGPMDRPDIVAAMAQAAVAGGAAGLRIEGVANLLAVRPLVTVPIIGIIKRDLPGYPVRITPEISDVEALAIAGADIIAVDATSRRRPVDLAALVAAIRARNLLVMADCATLDDGRAALALGASILGTTLSGYTVESASTGELPDTDLVAGFHALGTFVMAEGRYNTPQMAAAAILEGADCVTVGSAITRLEHVTGWFQAAIAAAGRT